MHYRNRVRIQRTAPFEGNTIADKDFHLKNPWEVVRPYTGPDGTRFSWHPTYEDAVIAAQFYILTRRLAAVA